MRTRSLHLSAEEWLLLGYLAGIIVWWVSDALRDRSGPERRSWTEQHATLSEDHLRRLEDGDRVAISRWHGGDLVLDGTMVLTAAPVEEDDDESE